MLWFASGAYLGLRKKRYKAMTYQSFNIIAVIRLAFSHAPRAYRRRAAAFDPPPRKKRAGANANDLPTHPHPLHPPRTPFNGVLT